MTQVLTFIDATTVTSPVKNLLAFCEAARGDGATSHPAPRAEIALSIFYRCADPAGQPPPPLALACQRKGIPIAVISERRRYDPAVLPAMRRIVDACRPDIIETHGTKPHFLVRLTRVNRGIPWIAYHHGYTAINRKDRAYQQLDRWSLRRPDVVVTVCRAFAADLARRGAPEERIRVLHNDIDTEHLKSVTAEEQEGARRQIGWREGERVIIALGRLSHEKGHRDLLDGFALLRRAHPDIPTRLALIGDGPERRSLEARALALGIRASVAFTGHQAEVAPFYRIASIMALPSYSEGSPNVVLEAMAYGVPIVATRVGGVPEMLTDRESALLTPAHQSEALCEALGALLRDKDLANRLAANARQRARMDHSPAARHAALLAIYDQLAASHGQTAAASHAHSSNS